MRREQVELLNQHFGGFITNKEPFDEAMQSYQEGLQAQINLTASRQSFYSGYENAIAAAKAQFERASGVVDGLRQEIDSPPYDSDGRLRVTRLLGRMRLALTDPRQTGWCVRLVRPLLASNVSIAEALAEREQRSVILKEVASGQGEFRSKIVQQFKPEEDRINGELSTAASQVRGIVEDEVFADRELTTRYVSIVPESAEQMARRYVGAHVFSMMGSFKDCVMFFRVINSRDDVPGLSQALALFGDYRVASNLTPEQEEQLVAKYPTLPDPVKNTFVNYLAFELQQQWREQGILTGNIGYEGIVSDFVSQTNRYLRGIRRSN